MATGTKPRTGSLGTQLRGKLASAYSERGHHRSNLWYVYSPKTGRDWVLRSDLEWGHFVLAESDPEIRDIDYAPPVELARVGDEDSATTLDAIVTLRNGEIEWREIKPSDAIKKGDIRSQRQWDAQAEAAFQKGVHYVRFTEHEIYANLQRIANWTRVVAWLSAVRGRSLHAESVAIAAMLHAHGSASIGEIQALARGAESVCFVAAAFKGIQDGFFASDLNDRPLNTNTVVSVVEGRT